jgi:hypothetical protein
MRSSTYFSPDYSSARTRFRDLAGKCGARLDVLSLSPKGPQGEDLTIDIAWLGSASPRRLLLHSSGLHGVEGFAGSAIQLQLLDHPPLPPPDTAIVIAHILNPFGMAWLQRVNENNVDLNRNFRTDGTYAGAPPMYARLDSFLNPRTPPRRDLFLAQAGFYVLRYGMAALRQSVVGGQYDFPRGLFFGGKKLEEGPRIYRAFLKERLHSPKKAVAIDVHTGLGKYATDSILVDINDYAHLRPVFGERVVPLQAGHGGAYRVEGGLESMILDVFAGSDVICLGQEFGTYSGVKVVHALREENRWRHYGAGTLDHASKRRLKETFCPDDPSWRTAVLQRGRELIDLALFSCSDGTENA